MKERPILFSAPMVRTILEGRKTQTRRAMKPQPEFLQIYEHKGKVIHDASHRSWCWGGKAHGRYPDEWGPSLAAMCPYGVPSEQLWVRETFLHSPADYCWEASVSIPCRPAETAYRADYPDSQPGEGWSPSIHMPRALSRITLEITGVSVERLQDISEADARAEGAPCIDEVSGREVLFPDHSKCGTFKLGYRWLWEQINGPDSWDANPWVWVIEFKRKQP